MAEPTLQQLEQQLKTTADMVETGLKDINENKATKQEVLDLIEDRTKEDKEMLTAHKSSIDEINNGLVETKAAIEETQKQIRNLKNYRNSVFNEKGRYQGRFSSPQEAKAFAMLVIRSVTANTEVESRFEWAKKGLESMGIDPYWVDSEGRKAMTGSSQVGGGALVTIEQIPSIWTFIELYGKFRANARILPMGAGGAIWPKLTSLITMYVPGEGGTITQTTPTIPVMNLVPKTLTGLTAYSLELEEDAMVLLGELLADLFGQSCAYYEDLCGFLGDGTSTYFGFQGIVGALMAVSATIASIKSLAVGSGNAYSELALADFEKVCGILPEKADNGDAKWYVHRYFFFTVMVSLALAAGSGTATEILTGAALRQRTYLSYPVEFSQVMPKAEANSQICALLANLRQGAVLGTRGGIEIAQSEHRYFDAGLVGVRVRDRIAINIPGAGDTTDAGPICGLITAAS